jgi:hypothetical protein
VGIQALAAGIALVPSVMALTVGRATALAFLLGIVTGLFVRAFPFNIVPCIGLGWLAIGIVIIASGPHLRHMLRRSEMFRQSPGPGDPSRGALTDG